MSPKSPSIDDRTKQDIVSEIQSLSPFYIREWNAPGDTGAGNALLQYYAFLLHDVLQHLNKVPEKNFIEFLHRMNISLKPPRPAAAPVVFQLSKGTPDSMLIPQRTQIGSASTESSPALIFETEQNLVVVPATVQSVVSVHPADDSFYEHILPTATALPERLFIGKNIQEHAVYFGHSKVFALKGRAKIVLTFIFDGAGITKKHIEEDLSWEWWSDNHWVASNVQAITDSFIGFDVRTTLKEDITSASKDIVVTTDIESDKRFPATGYLLIDQELYQYSSKHSNKFKDINSVSGIHGVHRTGNHSSVQISNGKKISTDVHLVGVPFGVEATLHGSDTGRRVLTLTLTKNFPDELTPTKIQQIDSIWLRCRTLKNTPLRDSLLDTLRIDTVRAGIENYSPTESIELDGLYFNDNLIDIKTSFYPFGRAPGAGDTFSIASHSAFSKKGANIVLEITLASDDNINHGSDNLSVIFQYWNGKGWQTLRDVTECFKNLGSQYISLLIPQDSEPLIHYGKESYWMRAKIVSGDYGRESYTYTDGKWSSTSQTVKPITVSSLSLRHKSILSNTLEHCMISNSGVFEDVTEHAGSSGLSFQPFIPLEDTSPAMYLGFDKPLSGGPLGVFLDLEEQAYPDGMKPLIQWESRNKEQWVVIENKDETEGFEKPGFLQFVIAKESSPMNLFGKNLYWIRAVDIKSRFARDEQIRKQLGKYLFDPALMPLLPSALKDMWLSAISETGIKKEYCRQEGEDAVEEVCLPVCAEEWKIFNPVFSYREGLNPALFPPMVKGIYVNAVRAVENRTFKDELLGSSNGFANQKYFVVNPPVNLAEVWIDEKGTISDEERDYFVKHGKNDIRIENNHRNEVMKMWVRWKQVNDFLISDHASRHIILEPSFGEIQFGNGICGMIPPTGSNNIRVTYQSGGGKRGNIGNGKIKSLISSLAGVEKAINPVAASGGADLELVHRALERGPKILRHRNRALNHEDIEWLVREAFSTIAKVTCLPTVNNAGKKDTGWIAVIIIPDSESESPMPSPELLRQVKTLLHERGASIVTAANRLVVTGPSYVEISVHSTITATSLNVLADAKANVLNSLSRFLHPLKGGFNETGWDFGRLVAVSDVIKLIEGTPFVDHIDSIALQLRDINLGTTTIVTDDSEGLLSLPPYAMINNGKHELEMRGNG